MNNNITEQLVSFEVAKLLKEKGFNSYCGKIYAYGQTETIDNITPLDNTNDRGYYLAPTQQLAIDWILINCNFI